MNYRPRVSKKVVDKILKPVGISSLQKGYNATVLFSAIPYLAFQYMGSRSIVSSTSLNIVQYRSINTSTPLLDKSNTYCLQCVPCNIYITASEYKMASYGKKRHVEASDESTLQAQDQVVDNDLEGEESSEDDSDLEEEAMDTEINEEIQVEFEAFPPGQGDFHGIKTLLQQLFLKSNVHLGGIADLLLSQNQIGCVVKQSEAQLAEESDSDDDMDDHVYGVTSVISLAEKEDTPCIAQIRDLLLTKCKECADSSCHAEFQRLLDKTRVGLLISERFLNIPPQLAPPLHLSLHKDLTRAKSKDEKWNFEYLVLMCKCYETMEQAKKKKKKKDSKLDQEIKSFFFANAEDEIFQKESILSFKYSILEETDTAIGGSWGVDETQLKTYRTVMVVPMLKMADILRDIQNNLSS